MKLSPSYRHKEIAAVMVMVLSLMWLTISLPFVNGAQLKIKCLHEKSQQAQATSEDHNPLSNTIEEKGESGSISISEYLHDQQAADQVEVMLINSFKCHLADLYYAFHPELLSPPPEILS